jgi:bifunctional oligoribonuclease and PAP phosphatase NrnA
MNDQELKEFLPKLAGFKSIAITAPAGADGDSVGTQCALLEIFESKLPGAKISVINEEPCPQRYLFLTGAQRFLVSADVLKRPKSEWPELMIVVDGGASRVGSDTAQLWTAAKARAQVDHHMITGPNDYSFRLYDPHAASTTELVFKWAQTIGAKLTQTLAQAIYVGVIFDTGMFKHSNTKPETLGMAAELLKTGFNHTDTAEKALMIRSAGAFKMFQTVMHRAEVQLGGQYIWSVLDQKTFLAAGGDPDDREGLIDQLFLVEKCAVAALYFERRPGEWKISFRSRGLDVAALAQSLNPSGGGHKQAAGCSLDGSQDSVLNACHQAVRKLLHV